MHTWKLELYTCCLPIHSIVRSQANLYYEQQPMVTLTQNSCKLHSCITCTCIVVAALGFIAAFIVIIGYN